MPIKPENRNRYPCDWKDIRAAILARAGHRCEGSPDYPDCRAVNYQPHPTTGSKVILTIAHLDHTPEHCSPNNLRAWCQRCHLNYDRKTRKGGSNSDASVRVPPPLQQATPAPKTMLYLCDGNNWHRALNNSQGENLSKDSKK